MLAVTINSPFSGTVPEKGLTASHEAFELTLLIIRSPPPELVIEKVSWVFLFSKFNLSVETDKTGEVFLTDSIAFSTHL